MVDFIFFLIYFTNYHEVVYILLFNKEKYKFIIMYKIITLIVETNVQTVKEMYKLVFFIKFECFLSKKSYVGHMLMHQHGTLLHDIFLEFRHFEYIC